MKNLLFTLNLFLLFIAVHTNLQAQQDCYSDVTISLDETGTALVNAGLLINNGNTSEMLVSSDNVDFYQSITYSCDSIGEFQIFVSNPNTGFLCSSLVTIVDLSKPLPNCRDTILIYGVFGAADEGVLAWAIDMSLGSYDNCTPQDKLRYTFGLHPDNDPSFVDSLNSSMTEINPWEVANGSVTRNIWVWDEQGNTDYCTVTIVIEQTLACFDSIVVSIDSNGEALVTVEMITGSSVPAHLEVSKNGIDFYPSIIFNCNDIGSATVTVRDSIMGSSCLSNITINDMILPYIEVKNYSHDFTDESEVIILTNEDIILESYDNCSYILDISQTRFDIYNLGHNEVLVSITDIFGNREEKIIDVYLTLYGDSFATICYPEKSIGTQNINCTREYIVASDVFIGNAIHDSSYVSIDNSTFVDTLFDFPDTVGSQFTVYVETIDDGVSSYCSSEVSLEFLCKATSPLAEILILDTIPPNTSPEGLIEYGFSVEEIRPTWSAECPLFTSYSDNYTITTTEFKIERTWVTLNSCTIGLESFIQKIEFRYECNSPFFKDLEDTTIETSPWTCDTDVCLPIPQLSDICNLEEVPYTVSSNDGNIIWDSNCSTNGGYRFFADSIGIFEITYQGTDCCGELVEKTISINVIKSQINITFTDHIVVELTDDGTNGDGVATLFGSSLMVNGFCYDSKLEIRRDTDNCGFLGNDTYNNDGDPNDSSDDTDDGQYVKFCSADITNIDDDGTPYGLVYVWIKVINLEEGYYTEVWTTIRVEDRQTAVIDEELKDLAIYPNPATNYMIIDVSTVDVSGDINVILYDITGQQVLTQSGNKIDLTSLNSGLYIYQIEIDGYLYSDKISIVK